MFYSKTSYNKFEQRQNRSLRIVCSGLHMSLEELLILDQGISAHRKQINTLLTEIYKTISRENPYFIKSMFAKKDAIHSLGTSNSLTLIKINTKRYDLYSFSFRASHL